MTKSFRFQTRFVSGLATPATSAHSHTFRLQIPPSPLQRSIQRLTSLLPQTWRLWTERSFPEWFLPQTIILKTEKTSLEPVVSRKLFHTEVEAYRRLGPLQGSVVPVCYGQAKYKNTNALLLQDVDGTLLDKPKAQTLTLQELFCLLEQCLSALYAYGVSYEDAHPSNFSLVGDHLVVFDFEQVAFDAPEDENVLSLKSEIYHLACLYVDMQASSRMDDFLEAA